MFLGLNSRLFFTKFFETKSKTFSVINFFETETFFEPEFFETDTETF